MALAITSVWQDCEFCGKFTFAFSKNFILTERNWLRSSQPLQVLECYRQVNQIARICNPCRQSEMILIMGTDCKSALTGQSN